MPIQTRTNKNCVARAAAPGTARSGTSAAPVASWIATAVKVNAGGTSRTNAYHTGRTRQCRILPSHARSAGRPPMSASITSAARNGPIGRMGASAETGSNWYQIQAHQEKA
jgi:hypothetical protein